MIKTPQARHSSHVLLWSCANETTCVTEGVSPTGMTSHFYKYGLGREKIKVPQGTDRTGCRIWGLQTSVTKMRNNLCQHAT